jgi:hypothetical protein
MQVGESMDTSGALFGETDGKMVGAPGARTAFSKPLGILASSAKAAREEVEADARRSYLTHRGTVKCVGASYLSVGQSLRLTGTEQDGLWMTTKVTHSMSRTDYRVEAEVARPHNLPRRFELPAPVAYRIPRLVGDSWRG